MKLEDIKIPYNELKAHELDLRNEIRSLFWNKLDIYDEYNPLQVDFILENDGCEVSELFITDEGKIMIVIDNREIELETLETDILMDIIRKLDWANM